MFKVEKNETTRLLTPIEESSGIKYSTIRKVLLLSGGLTSSVGAGVGVGSAILGFLEWNSPGWGLAAAIAFPVGCIITATGLSGVLAGLLVDRKNHKNDCCKINVQLI